LGVKYLSDDGINLAGILRDGSVILARIILDFQESATLMSMLVSWLIINTEDASELRPYSKKAKVHVNSFGQPTIQGNCLFGRK